MLYAYFFYPAMMRENVLKRNKTHYYYTFTALYQTELLPSLRQEARLELATSGVPGYVIIIRFAVWVFMSGKRWI